MIQLRWPASLTPFAALLVWTTLVLRLYLSVQEAGDQHPLLALLSSFSYFTVLTTLLVALAFSAPLWPAKLGFFARPDINTLIAASILLVAIVYTLMLRQLWDPQGLRKLVDVLLHDLIPLVFIAYWWLAVPKTTLRWRQVFTWLLYPLAYLAVIVLTGLLSGRYPYPFIDVEQRGYLLASINALGLLAFFAVLSCILIKAGAHKNDSK